MRRRWCWILCLTLEGTPALADEAVSLRLDLAEPPPPAEAAPTLDLGPVPDYRSPGCPGCPEFHPGIAVLDTFVINAAINIFDRITQGPEGFAVTPETWWDNLKHGFVFDDNTFKTNQFGHPYHGSTYFNAGRSNGLNYWQSGLVTALGSFVWECCGEVHPPAFNDFVATTLGGMAVGEVLHRVALLVRDNQATGSERFWREFGGLAVNPITGLNRMVYSDAFETRDNPPDRRPDYLGGEFQGGALTRGQGESLDERDTTGFVQVELNYGNPFRARARKPFDHFTMSARFGGGKAITEFNLRGRVYGGRDSEDPEGTVFHVNQGFTYITNPAYEIGGQSVDGVAATYLRLSSDFALVGQAVLGFIPLGAITAENVDVNGRTYDFGVGGETGVRAILWRRGFSVAQLGYALWYLHTVNGSGGEHLAQYISGQIAFPLFGQAGVGVAGALYLRNSYYPDPFTDTFNKNPELRAFVSWRID